MTFFILLRGDNAGLDHFPIKVISLTGALTDAGEDGITAVAFGDVVDEFHNDDGLADASTTEGSDLAAFGEGADEVDDFDAGFEDLGGGVLIGEGGGFAVDGIALFDLGWVLVIDGVAGDVEDAAEDAFTDRNGDGSAGVSNGVAAAETFGVGHGQCADPTVSKVLLDLADDANGFAAEIELDFESVIDFGQFGGCGEIHVHNGTDDLDDFADIAHRNLRFKI